MYPSSGVPTHLRADVTAPQNVTNRRSEVWRRCGRHAGVGVHGLATIGANHRPLRDKVVEELRRRGHDVVVSDEWSLGRLAAVRRDPRDGMLSGGADPRSQQSYVAGR